MISKESYEEKHINMDMLICDEKILKVTIPTVDSLAYAYVIMTDELYSQWKK